MCDLFVKNTAHWMNAIVCIDPMGIMREKFSLMFWPMHSLWPAQPMREIFSLALQGNSLQYDEITWIFKSDLTLLTSNRKGHRDKLVAKKLSLFGGNWKSPIFEISIGIND